MECTKYPGFQELLDAIMSCQDAWIRILPSSGYKKKPADSGRNEIMGEPWITRACVIPCWKGPEARNLIEPRRIPNTLKPQRETRSKGDRMGLGLTSQCPKTFVLKSSHFLKKWCGLDPGGPQKPYKSRGFGQKSQSVGMEKFGMLDQSVDGNQLGH